MFKNTLAVLEELESNLKCYICDTVVKDAVVADSCDHFFCKCCADLRGKTCLKCNLPSLTAEVKSYEIINSTVENYIQMKEMLQATCSIGIKTEIPSSESGKENSRMERSARRVSLVESNKITKMNESPSSNKNDKSLAVNKRNIKGETPLHVASIKGKIEDVSRFLDMGANPNNKDNAGWTPLHEACSHGFTDIAKLLLEHGANVNALGPDSLTPLHDAVANRKLDIAKLLLSSGADKTLKIKTGLTPIDLAKDDEIKAILNSETVELIPLKRVDSNCSAKFVLLSTGLNECEKIQFQKCETVLNARLTDNFTDEVTHLITSDKGERICPRTLKFLSAVIKGIWVVSIDWVDECLAKKIFVKEDEYEIKGTTQFPNCRGPYKGRKNAINNYPGLFSGCHFYFHGNFVYPSPLKKDFIQLVKQAGGTVMEEMPKFDIKDQKSHPFHVKVDSKLLGCAYFIIYCENYYNSRRSPLNLSHLKNCRTLSHSWLLNCLTKFKIVEP